MLERAAARPALVRGRSSELRRGRRLVECAVRRELARARSVPILITLPGLSLCSSTTAQGDTLAVMKTIRVSGAPLLDIRCHLGEGP